MHQPFTINRNLLTCIKSTFSLISPGFRFIRFSLKKSFENWQTIYLSPERVGWWLGGQILTKYLLFVRTVRPSYLLPGDQKDSLLSYWATDRGTLWRVLAGSHWWRLVELLAWTNHGQAQPGQSSTWLASEGGRPWWLHSEGPQVLLVPVQGAAQRPLVAFVIFILTLFVFA